MSKNDMYKSLWWLFICAPSTVLQIQVTYLVHLNLLDLINKQIAYKSYPCTCLDRPVGLQEAEAHRISRQSANEGCQPYAPADYCPFPRKYSWYSYLLETVSTPGSFAVGRVKKMTNPAAFRLVPQCLNQLHQRGHPTNIL